MAARFNLGQFLTGVMGQHPKRVAAFIDSLPEAEAARLMAAVEAGDNRPALKALVDKTGNMSAAKAAPAPEPTGSREPISGREWSARPDSYVQRTARDMADSLPPELASRVRAGDVDAAYDALRMGTAPIRRGRPARTEDSIRALAKPADQVAAESIAGQFDRAVRPGADVPTRQMELPISAGEREAYQRLADGRSVVRRGEVPEEVYADMVTQDLARQPFVRPYSAPDDEMRVAADMTFDEVPPRSSTPLPATQRPGNRAAKVASAAAAGAGAAYWAMQTQNDVGSGAAADEEAVQSGGEADLVEESRPAPKVAATQATPEPKVAQAPVDYSLQARALINRLNDMRRAAGGEVPEAPQMMAEINRLIALGNEQRRNPQYSHPQADPARDPYQQARDLIAQVNQMYQRGMTPNSPEVQRIMARVRQLQAQGDAIRNRRAG